MYSGCVLALMDLIGDWLLASSFSFGCSFVMVKLIAEIFILEHGIGGIAIRRMQIFIFNGHSLHF